VSTSNLDGERNLKPKQAMQLTQGQIASLARNNETCFKLQYAEPSKDIYHFEGVLVRGEERKEVGLSSFLPRGSQLRNSNVAYALVVYAGTDTKLVLNQGSYKLKISSLMNSMNKIIFYNMLLMFFLMLIFSQIGNRVWMIKNSSKHDYIFPEGEDTDNELYTAKSIMSFFLLLNMLVPLDLAVCTVLSKLFIVVAIRMDPNFYDFERACVDKEVVGCEVKNYDILEEFARITHIFCDKTGTLTKNKLEFRRLSVAALLCDAPPHDPAFKALAARIKALPERPEKLLNFFRCLCVCHEITQIHLKKTEAAQADRVVLSGSSQDEVCFLNMCRDVDFVSFLERSQDAVAISVEGRRETYKILRTVEFSSDRKRMSVIARREEDGRLFSFVKGADLTMLPALAARTQADEQTLEHMEDFAREGLRTLVIAMKQGLDTAELTEEAVKAMSQEEVERTFETGLELLGVTGLEDLLQDKVKETIEQFREAKIKVWMLTGDKGETAESVAEQCGLIDSQAQNIIKIETNLKEKLSRKLSEILDSLGSCEQQTNFTIQDGEKVIPDTSKLGKPGKSSHSLLISGVSLALAFEDDGLLEMLSKIFALVETVIVFRASPLQKAQTVKFIMRDPEAFTMAIGDGGNDVNMIQSATIGIGIAGNEGNQAANFSDYSIKNFESVRRLLFWHGRTFGNKQVNFVSWIVLKSIAFVVTNITFNLMNGMSAFSIMDGFYYALYNTMVTVIIPVNYFFYDQDVSFTKLPESMVAPPKPASSKSVASYDPTKGRALTLENVLGQQEHFSQMGIRVNQDGSTNNLSDYYAHCRDRGLKRMFSTYAVQQAFGIFAIALVNIIGLVSFGSIIGEDGTVNDFSNAGVLSFSVMALAFHLIVLSEWRHHDFTITVFNLISLCTFPINVWMSDALSSGDYANTQFSIIFKSPLFYLCLLVSLAIVVLPLHASKAIYHVVQFPEFSNIRTG